ncbi:MAG: PD-(D/E)XK motif protein, partial [Candidatus Methylumidiphilus sp.]
MATEAELNRQTVVKFVEALLLKNKDRNSITPGTISEQIDRVVALNSDWGEGLDRDWVTEELIRRFSLWVGQDTTLQNNEGHQAWLNTTRKQDWRYWQRYREWLEGTLSWKAVDALDQSTDTILGLLEDPLREERWDRRGLVVGHVQSGKTGSYTGLICKAADAGYKIIIVLAGMHNNLLIFMHKLLDSGLLTEFIVDSWQGPLDGIHDFVFGTGAIEVKSTVSPHGFPAKVASLDQLDDSLIRPLFLAAIRLELNTMGITLPILIIETRDLLNSNLIALACLDSRLLHARYFDAFADRYTRLFLRIGCRLMVVNDDFPRLTRANVALAIRNARYDLDRDLISLGDFEIIEVLKQL